METSSKTIEPLNELPKQRLNEIAFMAILHDKERKGLFINLKEDDKKRKEVLRYISGELKCTEEEFAKFSEHSYFLLLKRYYEIHGINFSNLDYEEDLSKEWITKRNEIAYNFLIHKNSVKNQMEIRFSPESGNKKETLMKAYDCSYEELNLFKKHLIDIFLKKILKLNPIT